MTKLQLTFDVELDLSEVPASEIEMHIKRVENNLLNMAYKAVEEGMITDDSSALIEDYKVYVDEVSDSQSQTDSPRPQ